MMTTMKQIWNYMIVALAGLSLLACNKGQDTPFEEEKTLVEGRSYTIAIAPETKSYLDGDHITWDEDDAEYTVIGWFATATEYNGHEVGVSGFSRINLNANPRTFTVSTPAGDIYAGEYIYAYYAPYAVDNESKTAAQLSILTEQQGLLKNSMPMVSLPISVENKITINTNEAIGTARFVNLGAVIEYNVFTSDDTFADENIVGINFEATTPIAGNFTVDLTQVSEEAIPSPSGLTENSVYSELDVPVTVGSSKDDGVKVYQVIAPGTVSGTITVYTDAASYQYTIDSKDFNRGKIRPLNVDLASANAVRLENPYRHTFTCGDWGIGADPTKHPDGDYYLDWGMTNPDVLDGATWTWTITNNENLDYWATGYFEFVNWPALMIGHYNSMISDYILSSDSFSGTITKVSLCFEVDGEATIDVSCTVGGNSFGTPITDFVSGTATFTGRETGAIAITLHSTDHTPAWLYHVVVEYEPL